MHKKQQAQDMYLSNIPPNDIARELEIDDRLLRQWIFGADGTGRSEECWYYLKNNVPAQMQVSPSRYRAIKPYIVEFAEAKLMKKVMSGIDALDDADMGDVDSLLKGATIWEKIHKIGRLERGEATEHIKTEDGFTLRDIQNGVRIVENEIKDEEDERADGKESGSTGRISFDPVTEEEGEDKEEV